jgi:hypothetical protein
VCGIVGERVVYRVRLDRIQGLGEVVIEASHPKQPSVCLAVYPRRLVGPVPAPLDVWMLHGPHERRLDAGNRVRWAVTAKHLQGPLNPGRQGHRYHQRPPPIEHHRPHRRSHHASVPSQPHPHRRAVAIPTGAHLADPDRRAAEADVMAWDCPVHRHPALTVAGRDARAELTGPREMLARLLHGGFEAKCAHVDVGQSLRTALFAQLMAPVSNPGGRLVEFRARCLRLVLGLRTSVRGEVAGGEAAVSEEACPHPYPVDSGLQAGGVGRRQLEAFDEEPLGFLGAHLGRLFDVWVHEFGQARGVHRVLVNGVELGQTRRSTVLTTSVGSHGIPSDARSR